MNVTLQQLRAFVAVARFESFTRAAQLLHITQPALTVRVRQLEEALELKLFDRTTRQVRLTATGKEIAPVLRSLLGELDAVVKRSKDIASKKTGTVRMACLPSVAASILPIAIAKFRKAYPDVNFVLKDEVGQRIVRDVRQEVVEFGITDVDVDSPDLTSTILVEDSMHVFYPSSHPIDSADVINVQELAKYPLILMNPESNARTMVDMAFAAKRLTPDANCEVIYMSTAIGMVRAGLGITILPSTAVEPRAMLDVRSRPIGGPDFIRRIAVVTKSDHSLSPAAHNFVDLLKKQVAAA
jgi:DNA-binding transcriptional LysR family regulator